MNVAVGLPALACSSCFFGEDGVRYAYYVSALVMFLLPLGIVGGVFRWLRRGGAPVAAAGPLRGTRGRPFLFATMGCGGLMLLVPVLESHDDPSGGALPILARIEPFELVSQSQTPLGSAQLAGAPWVANFVFTRCPTVCPKLSRRMAELQARTDHLAASRLVSFSIDPAHDTPEVLGNYALRFGAGPRWDFVTGPLAVVRRAVEQGLKVRMGDAPTAADVGRVLHGTHFVLVDGRSRIRGYYDVQSDATFEKLIRDLERLAPAGHRKAAAAGQQGAGQQGAGQQGTGQQATGQRGAGR